MIRQEDVAYFIQLTTPPLQIIPLADQSLCIINSNLFSNDPVIVTPSSRHLHLVCPIGDGTKKFIIDRIACYETVPVISALVTHSTEFYGPITGEASLYLNGQATKYHIYGFCMEDAIVGKLCFVPYSTHPTGEQAVRTVASENYYEYTYEIIDHAGTSVSLPTALNIKRIGRPTHKTICTYSNINLRQPALWKCDMRIYNLIGQLTHEIRPIIIENVEYYRELKYYPSTNPNPISLGILSSDRVDLHSYLQLHRQLANKLNLSSFYHYKISSNNTFNKHFCCIDYTSIVVAVMYHDGNIVNKLTWTNNI